LNKTEGEDAKIKTEKKGVSYYWQRSRERKRGTGVFSCLGGEKSGGESLLRVEKMPFERLRKKKRGRNGLHGGGGRFCVRRKGGLREKRFELKGG